MDKRIYSFSYLRAAACAAVVLLHICASESILYSEVLNINQTFIATVLYELMMWAVPCFLMVSGALLLDRGKEISINSLFKKYILRMLIALISFSFIYRIFDMLMNNEKPSFLILTDAVRDIYDGTGWSHMWYLYLMIGLYLLLPFMKAIASTCTNFEIRLLLFINLVVLSLLPITKLFELTSGFYIHIATIYPFYFFLGYAMHAKIIRLKKSYAAFFILVGVAGILVFTAFSVYKGFTNTANLLGYSSIFIIMISSGIFALFDSMSRSIFENGIIFKIIMSIDSCSFGIYLVHMLIVRLLLRYLKINLFAYGSLTVLAFLLVFFVTFTASYIIVWIYKRSIKGYLNQ